MSMFIINLVDWLILGKVCKADLTSCHGPQQQCHWAQTTAVHKMLVSRDVKQGIIHSYVSTMKVTVIHFILCSIVNMSDNDLESYLQPQG